MTQCVRATVCHVFRIRVRRVRASPRCREATAQNKEKKRATKVQPADCRRSQNLPACTMRLTLQSGRFRRIPEIKQHAGPCMRLRRLLPSPSSEYARCSARERERWIRKPRRSHVTPDESVKAPPTPTLTAEGTAGTQVQGSHIPITAK